MKEQQEEDMRSRKQQIAALQAEAKLKADKAELLEHMDAMMDSVHLLLSAAEYRKVEIMK